VFSLQGARIITGLCEFDLVCVMNDQDPPAGLLQPLQQSVSQPPCHSPRRPLIPVINLPPLAPRRRPVNVTDFMSVFDKDLLLDHPNLKSRCAVLYFSGVDRESGSLFLNDVVETIKKIRTGVYGGAGFIVRQATFFWEGSDIRLVFVSRSTLPMQKWHKVYTGLKAEQIQVLQIRRAPGSNTASFINVAAVFNEATTVDELVDNGICFDDDEVIPCFVTHTKCPETCLRRNLRL